MRNSYLNKKPGSQFFKNLTKRKNLFLHKPLEKIDLRLDLLYKLWDAHHNGTLFGGG